MVTKYIGKSSLNVVIGSFVHEFNYVFLNIVSFSYSVLV